MKPKQRPIDPLGIVGKEVRAADGGNYGCLVLAYLADAGEYLFQPIRWDTGLSDGICMTIDDHKITYRYDTKRPRVRTAEKR